MLVTRFCLVPLALLPLACAGCGVVPQARLTACQSHNRTLAEQSRAQLAEIENVKVHSRKVEDQLIKAEEELALLEQKAGIDRKQLANYKRERELLQQDYGAVARSGSGVPGIVSGRLAELSRRYSALQYDPQTGVSKFDADILFDSADAQLKPDAERMLTEFAGVLQSPEARDMKLMIVGHTDELKIARKEARERFPDNWRLSTGRAVAVADYLRTAGIPESRMGVAGYGGHQPISPNDTAIDRRKNRRVEIFVIGPDVPIVGWTESTTSLY